jgi:hypothetical protein
MNERIKLLADEATSYADTLDVADQRIYQEIRDREFAELIVRDCADMVKDAHKSGGGTYLHVLYERYGIEYPWVK